MTEPFKSVAVSLSQSRLEGAASTCLGIAILGILLLATGFVASFGAGWGTSYLAPGAAVVAAGTAGYVTVRSVVTWREQRLRDLQAMEDRHRETIYEEIASFMVGRFGGGGSSDTTRDSELRAKAALWGSAPTVKALAAWQKEITDIKNSRDESPTGATMDLTEDESSRLKQRLGEAVMSMRDDLSPVNGLRALSVEDIVASIFNEQRATSAARRTS